MTWSPDCESAWQAFARRGPWLVKTVDDLDYGFLIDFTIEVHLRNEPIRGTDVTTRLIEDGLAANPDDDSQDGKFTASSFDRGERIGELVGHLLAVLARYDEMGSAPASGPPNA